MIAIMLLTCDRPPERKQYARRCLSSLRNLRASELLWLHIADDGSDPVWREELMDKAGAMFGENLSITDAGGSGYGGSYNLATQVLHEIVDLVLPLEDDWELVRELNLDPIAGVLRDGAFGCVRLGYVGFTQELRASFVWARGLHWLALAPDSAEPHVFAGGPRLETVEYERAVGPWLEHEPAGVTEFEVAHRPAARVGVAWPVDLIHPSGGAFAHIGSEQAVLPEQAVTA